MSTTFQNQEKSLKRPKDMLHSTRTVQYCMISKHTSPMKCKIGHDVWLCTLLRILSIIKTWVVRHAPNHYRIALSQKIISNSYQQAFFAHRWQTQQLLYQWPSVLMLDLWCISFKSDAHHYSGWSQIGARRSTLGSDDIWKCSKSRDYLFVYDKLCFTIGGTGLVISYIHYCEFHPP